MARRKIGNTSDSIPVICSKIRRYRENANIEQKDLARIIGVTANSISNWENGRSRPDIALIPGICQALGITLYELFDIEDSNIKYNKEQQRLISLYEKLSCGHKKVVCNIINDLIDVQETESCPDLKVLSYFSRTLAAGIGDPTGFTDESEPVYVYMTPEVMKADSIFKVNGDSMEPEFSNGQDVLVQRIENNSTLEPGDIGAFIIGNETYIKKYEADGLYSLNPDYPVMRFEDDDRVYLIGRVLGVFNSDGYAKKTDIDKYKQIHSDHISCRIYR